MHANPAPWHRQLEARLEARCVMRASRVVHVSEQSRDVLRARYPSLHDRFEAISNGFDPADLADLPARRPSRADGPVRFLYAGSLRGTQVVGEFLDVFGELANREPGRLRLDLLGPIGSRFRSLAISAIRTESIGIGGPVSHAHALHAMADADVLVVFTGGGGAGADTMTGKLYECLGVRRPILLVGPDGPAAELVRSSGAGVVADPHDRSALRSAIERAAVLGRADSFTGAREEVLRAFDRRHLAERWSALLSQVVAAGPIRDQARRSAALR
jgi:glycosyltransferase involved in cell wall biosynthesis